MAASPALSAVGPSFAQVQEAAERIAPHAVRTPVLRNAALDALVGAELFFKCENLQRGGAFKFRGACNAVYALDAATAARGIVTQSSGNHGTAIALVSRMRGVPAHVVVPRNAPAIKLAQIREAGAHVVLCEDNMPSRNAAAAQVLEETGGTLVHPFDNDYVIAGQGTATLELLRETRELDAVMAPVSGGGLLSGTAIAAHGVAAKLRVFGAEPQQASDAHASLARGTRVTDMVPDTICDGLRAGLAERTFSILQREVEAIWLASEAEIVAAMRLLWERLKIVVEPSGAVPLAALLRQRERVAGLRIGVILSGGNVDLDTLPFLGDRPMIIDGLRASDQATTLVLAYYAAFNRGDWEGMLRTVSDDVAHDINQGAREVGRDAFARFLERMARCYKEELKEIVVMSTADGRHAAAEFVVHGSYLADDGGLPPARGQRYVLPAGAFFQVAGGRIARVSNYYNLEDWKRQVGG